MRMRLFVIADLRFPRVGLKDTVKNTSLWLDKDYIGIKVVQKTTQPSLLS